MNEKFKWIFLYGGVGWGLNLALFFSFLRWIEYKPPAFGSFIVLLLICILGGIVWGFFTQKMFDKKQKLKVTFFLYMKSILLLLFVLCIYGVCFRYVLAPHQLEDTFISTFLLMGLMIMAIFIHQKSISENKL